MLPASGTWGCSPSWQKPLASGNQRVVVVRPLPPHATALIYSGLSGSPIMHRGKILQVSLSCGVRERQVGVTLAQMGHNPHRWRSTRPKPTIFRVSLSLSPSPAPASQSK